MSGVPPAISLFVCSMYEIGGTPMNYDHTALREYCSHLRQLEQAKTSLQLQRSAFARGGMPPHQLLVLDDAITTIRPTVDRLKRGLKQFVSGTVIYDWISKTHGLSNSVVFVLGNMPALTQFGSYRSLWKYMGLHTVDGRAVKATRGTFLGFNRQLRGFAIARVGFPIVKVGGPYRAVYDARRAETMESHPPMVDSGCEFCDLARADTKALRATKNQQRVRTTVASDCANLGGIHWKDGHRHADAVRYTVKGVFRDAWLVANGLSPVVHLIASSHTGLVAATGDGPWPAGASPCVR